MTAIDWVIIISASVMPIGLILYCVNRIYLKKGVGVRGVQFMLATCFMPVIIILALTDRIDRTTIATLIGAMIGYVFANISKFDEKTDD